MIRAEIVPSQLAATIYQHEILSGGGPVPCWSYLSDGLRKMGQKELLLTVSRTQGERPSNLPLQFFAELWQHARAGDVVDAGGYSDFFRQGFLGPFSGAVYARAQPLAELPPGADTLAVLLITDEELEVASKCGTSRIITRLGDVYRHFPFPPWSDRNRNSVVNPAFWRESVLTKLPLPWLRLAGTRMRMENGRLRLALPFHRVSSISSFLSKFEPTYPVVLMGEPDPDADALLVWEPGQQEPRAITPEGSAGNSVGGGFVMFGIHDHTNSVQLVEDGFTMWLTRDCWARVRRAMQSGSPASVLGPDGIPVFDLSWWRPTRDDRPIVN
jgi:Domain of unknown function (DUF3480)